ncbi:MAG: ATP-binding protein [Gemmatimonadales bacterium]|nr:ATP-binding protein [Gemmatimonadales bacterium]MDZ4390400.1 ATP-binding protein [Gemmatimonadales bacterium]
MPTPLPTVTTASLTRAAADLVKLPLPSGAASEDASQEHHHPRTDVVAEAVARFRPAAAALLALPRGAKPAWDLPVAIATLAVDADPDEVTALATTVFVGELTAAGEVRPVRGVLSVVEAAIAAGYAQCVVPGANAPEVYDLTRIKVVGVATLAEAWAYAALAPLPVPVPAEQLGGDSVDFVQVRGHEAALRGLMIGAAGGHSVHLHGPSGSGKTMLARRAGTILPPMTRAEERTVLRHHSAAGIMPVGRSRPPERPFRAPHHTISLVGLLGNIKRLGEMDLAAHGVLFCDEADELFDAIQRQGGVPETCLDLARKTETWVIFATGSGDARGFNQGDHTLPTAAAAAARRRVAAFAEIQIPLVPHSFDGLLISPPATTSAVLRMQVIAARAAAEQRYRKHFGAEPTRLNGAIDQAELSRISPLSSECQQLLDVAVTAFEANPLAAHRVARTIADLEGTAEIALPHMSEAITWTTGAPVRQADELPPSRGRR